MTTWLEIIATDEAELALAQEELRRQQDRYHWEWLGKNEQVVAGAVLTIRLLHVHIGELQDRIASAKADMAMLEGAES